MKTKSVCLSLGVVAHAAQSGDSEYESSGGTIRITRIIPDSVTSSPMAAEGIRFTVEGPATYERLAPLRNPAALAVQ